MQSSFNQNYVINKSAIKEARNKYYAFNKGKEIAATRAWKKKMQPLS